MKFVRYDGDRFGLLTTDEDGIVDLTQRLGIDTDDPLKTYVTGNYDAVPYLDADPDVSVDAVRLEPPIAWPGKIVCAPGNYVDHQAEMTSEWTIKEKGYFLKAPSSLIGPDDTIVLPWRDRRCDHEVELAFVMGQDVRDVQADEVLDTIFGYTILLDITVRGDEDRSSRKSYDTFTVTGPCVATPDEIGDPQQLELELSVNDEVRQRASTEQMILSCAEFASFASNATTINAGDLVTTGTPSGVSPLADDDVVRASIQQIGSMTLDVTERDARHEELTI